MPIINEPEHPRRHRADLTLWTLRLVLAGAALGGLAAWALIEFWIT